MMPYYRPKLQAAGAIGSALFHLCVSLRSSAPLRLLLFTDIFTAETQRNSEIRRDDPLHVLAAEDAAKEAGG